MRMNCRPPSGNLMVVPFRFTAPQPSSSQPQAARPQPEHSSRFTARPEVLPMRYAATPAAVVEFLNCTQTESFAKLLPSAFNRIHSLYVWVGSATNGTSTKLAGFAAGAGAFAAPAFGL